MARRNKYGKGKMYAMPTTSGSSQMSATFDAQDVGGGYTLTAKKICAALGLVPDAVDAIKITSIILSPPAGNGILQEVNFADGALFKASDRMKPTKIKPSQLSPAGRWTNANSDTELAKVTGSTNFIINVAVRKY